MIDEFGNPRAFQMNVDREYERNLERYTFLKWGQNALTIFVWCLLALVFVIRSISNI